MLNLFFLIPERNFLTILYKISSAKKYFFLAVAALIIYNFKCIAY